MPYVPFETQRVELRRQSAHSASTAFAAVSCLVLLASCGADQREPPRRAALSTLQPLVPPSGNPARAGYAPWPSSGHDAAHSGAAPVTGPRTGRLRWRRRLDGPVVPGPAIGAGGIAYAASNGGVLHALDITTGRDRWRFDGGASYGGDLSTTPLVTPAGIVVWPGPRETLFAVSRSGQELWHVALGGQPLSPARAPDGTIIAGDMSGGLRALRPAPSGPPRTLWKLDLGSISYGSPAVARDGTVYTTVDSDLVAVRAGRELWRVHAGDLSEVSPAITPDGTIVFAANDGIAYGVRPDGKVRWRYKIGALTYSSPAATRDGLVYLGDHRGFVTALDAATGKPVLRVLGLGRTRARRSVGVWTQPVVDARHNVYFGTRPGHVYGFDVRGRRLFDIDAGATVDSYPALAADGTLLIGTEAGELLAIADR